MISKRSNTDINTDFVEAFDALIRLVVVPGSHKPAADLQMGPQDVRALTWLGHNGQALMAEFAKGVGVPLSTATRLVDRLIEKGVVTRQRSDDDRRIVRIALTTAGKKLDERFFSLRLATSRTLLAKLNAADQRVLVSLLKKVVATDTSPR
jgi:DNA-binding MarR family transcriptional regulator